LIIIGVEGRLGKRPFPTNVRSVSLSQVNGQQKASARRDGEINGLAGPSHRSSATREFVRLEQLDAVLLLLSRIDSD
jgi:hypothetical protein